MPDSKLVREAEIPRPRTSGVAVVLVAALAMFAAVSASAFAIRVRMGGDAGPVCKRKAAMREITPVTLVDTTPSSPSIRAPVTELEREAVRRFHEALAAEDDEAALEAYALLPRASAVRETLTEQRDAVLAGWLDRQLTRLADDLEGRDCDAVDERLRRLGRLVPDKQLPDAMAECVAPRPRAVRH
jgi:hypothetical protein